jgi:competence ComEA-like helix-hairpin-helix protein
MKRILKDYFTFSRKERVALIVLSILIAVFIALPYVIKIKKAKPVVDDVLQQEIIALQQPSVSRDSIIANKDSSAALNLFPFDPNTLDEAGWQRLGIRQNTIRTILNYRNKGGKFYKPEDLRKIWGMLKGDADRLIPFVTISSIVQPSYQTNFRSQKFSASVFNGILDINIATAEQFMQVPGMEHTLSYRIINYREKLGGFYVVEQLRNVYGMTDSVFELIKVHLKTESTTIKKVNINTATFYALSQNPFIRKDIATAIIVYRNQHGLFHQLDDLKKIVFITDDIYHQIVPYITVEEMAK